MKKKNKNFKLFRYFLMVLTSTLMQASYAAGSLCTSNSQCDDGLWCNGVEKCLPDDPRADVDGCTPGMKPEAPGTTRASSGVYWRCDENEARWIMVGNDVDGDGHDAYDIGGDDCDDHDANRFPGNAEVCDSHDEDCDPTTVGIKDSDGDGYNDSACFNIDASGKRNFGGRL